jgi:hypothetical protein
MGTTFTVANFATILVGKFLTDEVRNFRTITHVEQNTILVRSISSAFSIDSAVLQISGVDKPHQ